MTLDIDDPEPTVEVVLGAGDCHDVHPNVVHSFEVLESGVVIEVYWPADGVRFSDIKRLDTGGKIPAVPPAP